MTFKCLLPIICLSHLVTGHLVLLRMDGETNGQVGVGMGVVPTTPRSGSQPIPFQLDSAVFTQAELTSGRGPPCGRTVAGGALDLPSELKKAENRGLPDVGRSGLIRIVGHQVNADGGGGYSCAVDPTASGTSFTRSEMIVNVPGRNGQSNAQATNFPIVTQIPPGMQCSGGNDGKTCVVRCLNTARNGPFGGCMAFTQNTNSSDPNTNRSASTPNQRTPDKVKLTSTIPRERSKRSLEYSLTKKSDTFSPTELMEEISSSTVGARRL
ncbi:secreted protein [Melampsora americana]|nr:secreted protein [Melampsora americana]